MPKGSFPKQRGSISKIPNSDIASDLPRADSID